VLTSKEAVLCSAEVPAGVTPDLSASALSVISSARAVPGRLQLCPRCRGDRPQPAFAAMALVLFLLAAAGGVLMNLKYHLEALPLPVWLVLVHAAVAVVAFLLLALAAWGGKT
jgi:hypothetical protein